MTCPFTNEELEAYVLEPVDATRVDEIEAHTSSCSRCRDEVDWLRLEQASLAGRHTRSDSDNDDRLWQAIEARIGNVAAGDSAPSSTRLPARHRVVWFGSGFAAATMAAAVLVLYLQVPQVSQPRMAATRADAAVAIVPAATNPDPAALALDQAEAEYTTAIAALEAEYVARRGVVNPAVAIAHDRTMSESRRIIGQARAEAGDNIDARVRVLDAYSSHLRTVQAVVAEL